MEAKQRWREANRVRLRKSDTMRDLVIRVDAGLVTGESSALGCVFSELRTRWEADGASVHVAATRLAQQLDRDACCGTICFERRVRSRYDPVQKHWEPLDDERLLREAVLLVVLTAEQLVAALADGSLRTQIASATAAAPATGVERADETERRFVFVTGVDAHLHRLRTQRNRDYARDIRMRMEQGLNSQAVRVPTGNQLAGDIEDALMGLQLVERYYVVRPADAAEVIECLYAIACDVSIRPYKLLQRDSMLTYQVARTRRGASDSDTFQMMLEQIAITVRYPTFRALSDAYEAADAARRRAATPAGSGPPERNARSAGAHMLANLLVRPTRRPPLIAVHVWTGATAVGATAI
ncbi:hypothetical protein MSPP1_003240 [Malassezia sp. CBS 17886]|nr:hypothetical protein MSPP1_003240 [Malassezia sp. CBS 17886]